MNSYKKLISNSSIFAIGRLGSKLISFLLVPLYTYYLSSAEYGTVDLIIATVNMLLPIVSVHVFDAVLRFTIEDPDSKDAVISNALFIGLIAFGISLLFFPLLNIVNNLLYTVLLYMILFAEIVERIFAEYLRANNKIKTFAINGILISFLIGFFNIISIVVLELGVIGYLFSMFLAYSFSALFLLVREKIYKDIKPSLISIDLSIEFIQYSTPMIPNSLMWWLINASSRYFITFFVGLSANGLFAIASRVPTLINIFTQIFTQAWQVSAIEEYDKENNSLFFSNVFSYYSSFIIIFVAFVMIIIKLFIRILFAAEFYDAWVAVPFLLLGSLFSSFSGFLGTNYLASKKTSGVFKTSIYGGIVSLVLNFILISSFGIIGAGISSMFSFFTMWIVRYFDTKKYVELKIQWKELILNISLIFIQIIVLFLNLHLGVEMTINSILFIVIILINRNKIMKIFSLIPKRSKG